MANHNTFPADFSRYRSLVYSWLKVSGGWNGVYPSAFDVQEAEQFIAAKYAERVYEGWCAQVLLNDLAMHGATFRPRVDGLPNRIVTRLK